MRLQHEKTRDKNREARMGTLASSGSNPNISMTLNGIGLETTKSKCIPSDAMCRCNVACVRLLFFERDADDTKRHKLRLKWHTGESLVGVKLVLQMV